MTSLRCKHCPQLFTSLLIIPEDAIAEVSTQFTRHLVESHRDQHALALQKHQIFAALSVWLVIVCNHTDIMDDERLDHPDNQNMFNQVGKVLAQLGGLIGQDLTIEDEGDNESENGNEDESNEINEPETDVPILPNLKLGIN